MPPPRPGGQVGLVVGATYPHELARALVALPSEQRTLIERAFYGELSHSEIAAETGLPLGTIKSRIRLALDKLRRQMG